MSIAINLGITPLVHRALGPIAGLLLQPLMIWILDFRLRVLDFEGRNAE